MEVVKPLVVTVLKYGLFEAKATSPKSAPNQNKKIE